MVGEKLHLDRQFGGKNQTKTGVVVDAKPIREGEMAYRVANSEQSLGRLIRRKDGFLVLTIRSRAFAIDLRSDDDWLGINLCRCGGGRGRNRSRNRPAPAKVTAAGRRDDESFGGRKQGGRSTGEKVER